MSRSAAASILVCALFVGSYAVPVARAQGTGRSEDIDLSVRSTGMGGASNAVFRGGDLNHWGNPALLAQARGIRYEWGDVQLVPGLASDVKLEDTFTKIGGGGFGLVFGGKPAGKDGVFLSYGVSQGTDEGGNPTGTWSSYERVESWGFGVSLIESIESIRRLAGAPREGWSRHVDVSFGMAFKEAEINLLPSSILSPVSGIQSQDIGALVRVTPLDQEVSGVPMRVDAAYGWSVLNHDDTEVVFLNEDMASPLTRHHRHGLAFGFEAGYSTAGIESPRWRELARGLMPLFSLTFARDWVSIGAGDVPSYETDSQGFEIAIAQVFAFRRGDYEDRLGDIDGEAHGWSLSLPVGRWAGFTYDESWFPQAQNSDLEDVRRKSYAVWLDPFEIAAALRSR